MTTFRKITLKNNSIYHVYNRSIDRKPIFTNVKEYSRALMTIQFYQFSNIPTKLSKFLTLQQEIKQNYLKQFCIENNKLVDIFTYCLMNNHFHFLLEQKQFNGISKFLSNFENSYSRYYNTKMGRIGPIFEGIFKAVYIETDEQFIHLSRYIHLNPVASNIIPENRLETYPWSSLNEYLKISQNKICNTHRILEYFPSIEKYKKFIYDQIAYAKELEKIKHLIIEDI